MKREGVNLEHKFTLFDEQWSPKIIAEMNDYQLKLVKLEGDFIWHDHPETDETFFVLDGTLRIDFEDAQVHVSSGELFVVPRGVRHNPYAEQESHVTAENDVWI